MRLKPNDNIGMPTNRNDWMNGRMRECGFRAMFKQEEVMSNALPPNGIVWSLSFLCEIDIRVSRR